MEINAGWQALNLDNKRSGSFISAGTAYQYAGISFMLFLFVRFSVGNQPWEIPLRTQNIRNISIEMMRGELRGEICACLRAGGRAFRQVEQGIVTEEGKI